MTRLHDGRNRASNNVSRMIREEQEVRRIGDPNEQWSARAKCGILYSGPGQRCSPLRPIWQHVELAVKDPSAVCLCDDAGMDRFGLMSVTRQATRERSSFCIQAKRSRTRPPCSKRNPTTKSISVRAGASHCHFDRRRRALGRSLNATFLHCLGRRFSQQLLYQVMNARYVLAVFSNAPTTKTGSIAKANRRFCSACSSHKLE